MLDILWLIVFNGDIETNQVTEGTTVRLNDIRVQYNENGVQGDAYKLGDGAESFGKSIAFIMGIIDPKVSPEVVEGLKGLLLEANYRWGHHTDYYGNPPAFTIFQLMLDGDIECYGVQIHTGLDSTWLTSYGLVCQGVGPMKYRHYGDKYLKGVDVPCRVTDFKKLGRPH